MNLFYKERGKPTTHQSIKVYTMIDGTHIGMFQGFRGQNPKLDMIIKYQSPNQRLRTPSHTHWIVDLLVKADYNKSLVKEFVESMIHFYDQIEPFKNEDQRLKYELSTYRNFGQQYSLILNTHAYYQMDTLCGLLELFSINEKQTTGAFMFKTLLELVKDYCEGKKDFYQIVGYSKRV